MNVTKPRGGRKPGALVFLTLTGVLALGGCGRGGGSAPVAGSPTPIRVPASALVYYDNSGGIQDSLRLVIRDEEAFRQIWTRATSTQSSPPPLPAIDFRNEMVFVVAAGRMTPEDMVRVDTLRVHEELTTGNRRLPVLDVLVETVRGCRSFASDAYPIVILRVDRFDGEVRFTERVQRGEGCPAAARPVVSRPERSS